jgi:hypothetical protein
MSIQQPAKDALSQMEMANSPAAASSPKQDNVEAAVAKNVLQGLNTQLKEYGASRPEFKFAKSSQDGRIKQLYGSISNLAHMSQMEAAQVLTEMKPPPSVSRLDQNALVSLKEFIGQAKKDVLKAKALQKQAMGSVLNKLTNGKVNEAASAQLNNVIATKEKQIADIEQMMTKGLQELMGQPAFVKANAAASSPAAVAFDQLADAFIQHQKNKSEKAIQKMSNQLQQNELKKEAMWAMPYDASHPDARSSADREIRRELVDLRHQLMNEIRELPENDPLIEKAATLFFQVGNRLGINLGDSADVLADTLTENKHRNLSSLEKAVLKMAIDDTKHIRTFIARPALAKHIRDPHNNPIEYLSNNAYESQWKSLEKLAEKKYLTASAPLKELKELLTNPSYSIEDLSKDDQQLLKHRDSLYQETLSRLNTNGQINEESLINLLDMCVGPPDTHLNIHEKQLITRDFKMFAKTLIALAMKPAYVGVQGRIYEWTKGLNANKQGLNAAISEELAALSPGDLSKLAIRVPVGLDSHPSNKHLVEVWPASSTPALPGFDRLPSSQELNLLLQEIKEGKPDERKIESFLKGCLLGGYSVEHKAVKSDYNAFAKINIALATTPHLSKLQGLLYDSFTKELYAHANPRQVNQSILKEIAALPPEMQSQLKIRASLKDFDQQNQLNNFLEVMSHGDKRSRFGSDRAENTCIVYINMVAQGELTEEMLFNIIKYEKVSYLKTMLSFIQKQSLMSQIFSGASSPAQQSLIKESIQKMTNAFNRANQAGLHRK